MKTFYSFYHRNTKILNCLSFLIFKKKLSKDFLFFIAEKHEYEFKNRELIDKIEKYFIF